jgi:hypothetical protein
MEVRNSDFMRGFAGLIGNDLCFLCEHDRDVVADRIEALAGFALQSAIVWKESNPVLTNGADEDIEEFFWNRHKSLQSIRKNVPDE